MEKEQFKWDVYRVKKEFKMGSVLWPVGAIRFWTPQEASFFRGQVSDYNNWDIEVTQNWFADQFETVYWHC